MALYDAYNRLNISAPHVDFRANRWKPKELTFEAPDNSITQKALAIYEDRQNKLMTKREALATKFETMRDQFGDDAETQKWFDANIMEAENQINDFAARGDVFGATEAASNFGNKFVTSAETTARKNAWTDYKNLRDKVRQDKTLDPTTIKRWEHENKFKTNLKRDANGNVVGYDPYKTSLKFSASGMPVADIDWTAGLKEVIGLAAEKKTTVTDSDKTSSESYVGGQYGSFTKTSNGLLVKTEKGTVLLPYKKLHENLIEWANRNQDALLQGLRNKLFEEEGLIEELNNTTDPQQRATLEKQLKYYKQFRNPQTDTSVDFEKYAELMMDTTIANAAKHDTTIGRYHEQSTGSGTSPEDEATKARAAVDKRAAAQPITTGTEGGNIDHESPHYSNSSTTYEEVYKSEQRTDAIKPNVPTVKRAVDIVLPTRK